MYLWVEVGAGEGEEASAAIRKTAAVWILGGWRDKVKSQKVWEVSGHIAVQREAPVEAGPVFVFIS